MDGEEEARLLRVIAESDAILEAHSGSLDPAVIRQVSDALGQKANALESLQRFGEAVSAWDDLLSQDEGISGLRRLDVLCDRVSSLVRIGADERVPGAVDELLVLFDELKQPEGVAGIAAWGLSRKEEALDRVGRLNDAARADDDLLNRFGDNPDVSEPVSRALRNRAARLLEKPGGVDEVLAISERLRVLVAQEPEDSLAGVAENVNSHLNDLVSVGSGPVSFIAMTVAGMGLQGLERLDALLCRVRPRLGAKLAISGKVHGLVGVLGPLEPARRRLIQALNVSRELIDRTGQSDDLVLRRQWATAQIYRAAALMALGRPAEAFEAFGAIQSAEETGGSAALSWFADHTKTTDVTGKVTKFAFSRLHAQAREAQQ